MKCFKLEKVIKFQIFSISCKTTALLFSSYKIHFPQYVKSVKLKRLCFELNNGFKSYFLISFD